jgi:hypothetical protein
MNKKETSITLPDNVIDLKPKDVNVNIEGNIVSVSDLEKIFFFSKLNCEPDFIASMLSMDVMKVNDIVNSCNFQSIVSEYLSEYMTGNAGEKVEQLTLRYKDFLRECFTSLRISTHIKIQKSIEDNKPLSGKALNIPLLEKIMKMEFAMHGLPVDLRGYMHVSKKESKDKTEEELMEGIEDIKGMISNAGEKFNPNEFKGDKVEEAEVIEEKEEEDKETK